MSLININGDQDDLFYRYKMPPVQSKIEGKGNGIKTVIPNMTEVAKALGRPPMYPCKYFGTELGAQTKHEPKNDRYIVNGAHEAQRLQELLDGFIQKFVLCTSCKNPETTLKITPEGSIFRDCQACGQHSSIDMRHKLVNYILNHPPPGAIAAGTTVNKQSKKKGKGKLKEQALPRDDDEHDAAGDAFLAKITEEAKTLAEPASIGDDWSVDLSEHAQMRRQAELSSGMDRLQIAEKKGSKKDRSKKKTKEDKENESEEEGEDPLDQLASYTKHLEKVSADALLREIQRLDVPMHYAVHVLAQVLLSPATITSDIKQHQTVFKQLLSKSSKAPLYFLGGIERLVSEFDLHKKVPFILKAIYETELVDEAGILAWGEKPTKKFTGKSKTSAAVHEAAEPFLKWLRETEEEEEEESEEESDAEE